ncbi:MAG: hypothetical protein KC435_13845 [Thermomicrobiales bacterium]|nr:hypothetical protein [Thermomicrobiales bacterium]
MINHLFRIIAVLTLVLLPMHAAAREGDTLEPISIEAPNLVTYPENLLSENDFKAISGRVQEARNSGVPLAVRIVDVSQPTEDIPFAVRRYASTDFTQPLTSERKTQLLNSWIESEAIETSEGANDGFLLLVLVPEDRTMTQAIWWIGPNALPLNGLTAENIAATQTVMQREFDAGNMPNGIYLGISEFSYNIQFGEPAQLERTTLQNTLHTATTLLGVGTALAGLAVPVVAWMISRRPVHTDPIDAEITPWEAAALHDGRATSAITTAMLLDAVHRGEATPTRNNGLLIEKSSDIEAIALLQPFADSAGSVPPDAMNEIESITMPVRIRIENRLADIGAFNARAHVERMWMLIAMAVAALMAVGAVAPTVRSMSAIGVLGIVIALLGVGFGWWWLSRRRYTTVSGEALLASWLQSASREERILFDLATEQTYLVDQTGGPNTSLQTQLVRRLRGLGAH